MLVDEDERNRILTVIRNQSTENYKQCKPSDLPKVTCECGRRPTIHHSHQCFYCGIYFCIVCAKEHFKEQADD